jgi:anti-sigma factor RsiW
VTTRPTDQELMLYADGELGDERRAEVETHLASDETARRKLWGLRMTSDLVREAALELSAADSIADAVMGKIGAESKPNGAHTETPSKQAEVIRIGERRPAALAKVAAKRAANDSARSIWMLTAAAVAAAAGMMIWGRMDAAPTADRSRTQSTASPVEVVAPVEAPKPLAAEEPAPTPDGELEMGVEVAAVDFGARTGTIFYVAGDQGASSPTTTVVWLADDVAGGE